jgi:hypothetical protein
VTNSKLAWSPGAAALAVPVLADEKELTWPEYLSRLQKQLRQLSQRHNSPGATYNQEWWDRMGSAAGLPQESDPASHLETDQFAEMLSNVHHLNPSSFPKQIKPSAGRAEEMETYDLESWLMEVLPSQR